MPKLLIVDDNPSIRLVLGHWFEQQAFQVAEAANGIDALQIAEHTEIDAALIDIGMSRMDGIELCRRLLARQPVHRPLAIWLMTGARTTEIEAAGIAAGAKAVLAKPFSCVQLLADLNASLGLAPPSAPAV